MNELGEEEKQKIIEYFCLSPGNERPLALWIIGRPAAGKTTTATILVERLRELRRNVALVDGEVVRSVFDGSIGYSKDERVIALRRLVNINELLQSRGVIPVTATIGGLDEFRHFVQRELLNVRFIFLDCSFEQAARRDQKGLYAKALAGQIRDFFGVDIEFEEPKHCDLKLNSGALNPNEIVDRIIRHILEEGLLKPSPSQNRS